MYSKKVLIFKNPNLQIIPQFGRGNTTVSIFGMNLTHIFFSLSIASFGRKELNFTSRHSTKMEKEICKY